MRINILTQFKHYANNKVIVHHIGLPLLICGSYIRFFLTIVLLNKNDVWNKLVKLMCSVLKAECISGNHRNREKVKLER